MQNVFFMILDPGDAMNSKSDLNPGQSYNQLPVRAAGYPPISEKADMRCVLYLRLYQCHLMFTFAFVNRFLMHLEIHWITCVVEGQVRICYVLLFMYTFAPNMLPKLFCWNKYYSRLKLIFYGNKMVQD